MEKVKKEEYYVYIYLDHRKPGWFTYGNLKFVFEPFYVGKGYKNRMNDHRRENTELRKKYIFNKINKIFVETGKEPISFKYQENMLEQSAYDLKEEIVDLIGRKNLNRGPLINLVDGGNKRRTPVLTEKQKNHSGKFKKGIRQKEEYIIKADNARKGLKVSFEKRLTRSRKSGGTPILQYSLKGEFIKEWSMAQECFNSGFRAINNILRDNKRMTKGFLWIKKISNDIPLFIEPFKPSTKSLNKYKNL